MASVFRQMLVMVKTVEARSTSKTNQRDSHAVPEMPACILKFPGIIHYSSEKTQPFLSNVQTIFPNQWVSNQCYFTCKRLQSISSQGASETGKSPVTNFAGIFSEILVSVSKYLCVRVCVTTCGHQGLPQPSSCSCKLRLPQPHSEIESKQLWPAASLAAMPLCCAEEKGLSLKLRFLLATLAGAHPPWKFQADQLGEIFETSALQWSKIQFLTRLLLSQVFHFYFTNHNFYQKTSWKKMWLAQQL